MNASDEGHSAQVRSFYLCSPIRHSPVLSVNPLGTRPSENAKSQCRLKLSSTNYASPNAVNLTLNWGGLVSSVNFRWING